MSPRMPPRSIARRRFMAGATLPLLLAGFGAQAQSRGLTSRPQGGFRFLPGSPVFAGGGVAEPGFAIVHAVLARWVPLATGFGLVERQLEAAGRPMQALCGLQLRLPRQLSVQEFADFNAPYVEQLQRSGVVENRLNPVSRTNVSPASGAPEMPSLHAFSYTVPYAGNLRTFTMSGMVERAPEGVVAEGDRTPEGMQRKLAYVLGAVTDRIAELGFAWPDATHVELYAAEQLPDALAVLAARAPGSVAHGVRQHYGRPPVVGLELELEARAVLREETVPV
jgi:hypothetical protein